MVVQDILAREGNQNKAIIKEIILRKPQFLAFDFMCEGSSLDVDAQNIVNFYLSLPRGRHLWLLQPHDSSCNTC